MPLFTREPIFWRAFAAILVLIHDSLDPKTKKHSVDAYPETSHIGTIAMREKEGVS